MNSILTFDNFIAIQSTLERDPSENVQKWRGLRVEGGRLLQAESASGQRYQRHVPYPNWRGNAANNTALWSLQQA